MSEIGIGNHRSRWFNTMRGNGSAIRSTSLPSKTILRNVNIYNKINLRLHLQQKL